MTGKAGHAASFGDMRMQGGDINALVIDPGAIAFKDMRDECAILCREKQRRVIADIAKPLNDHALAGKAGLEAGFGDILGVAEKGLQTIMHAAAGRLCPAGNAAHLKRM